MSESQSRYSIVERMNKSKLDIMSAKADLKDSIKTAEQKVDALKKEIDSKKKQIQARADAEKSELDAELIKQQNIATNLKERQPDKEALFDAKIKSVDSALEKIESISKSSQV